MTRESQGGSGRDRPSGAVSGAQKGHSYVGSHGRYDLYRVVRGSKATLVYVKAGEQPLRRGDPKVGPKKPRRKRRWWRE